MKQKGINVRNWERKETRSGRNVSRGEAAVEREEKIIHVRSEDVADKQEWDMGK